MTRTELDEILRQHKLWRNHKKGGKCANLTGACLTGANLGGADLREDSLGGADLRGANLDGADLREANLREANLGGANLGEADLGGADLRGADLRGANLRFANLGGANLSSANLSGTCLDPDAPIPPVPDAEITGAGMELRVVDGEERVYGWRTRQSQYVGNRVYTPGEYIAPVFSVDTRTTCHPGIYIAGRQWLRNEYPSERLVRCYTRRCDLLRAGGKWRTRRLVVCEEGGERCGSRE